MEDDVHISGGYVMVPRILFESDLWHDRDAIRLFMYYLQRANHSDGEFNGVTVKRGDLYTSYRSIAEACLWIQNGSEKRYNPKRIKELNEKLERDGYITVDSNRFRTIVTVCDYDIYQSGDSYKNTAKATQSGNAPETRKQRNKNYKKNKKYKNDNSSAGKDKRLSQKESEYEPMLSMNQKAFINTFKEEYGVLLTFADIEELFYKNYGVREKFCDFYNRTWPDILLNIALVQLKQSIENDKFLQEINNPVKYLKSGLFGSESNRNLFLLDFEGNEQYIKDDRRDEE